jgi:hypothetical protein
VFNNHGTSSECDRMLSELLDATMQFATTDRIKDLSISAGDIAAFSQVIRLRSFVWGAGTTRGTRVQSVVVLNYRFWQRHFDCDPHVLGGPLETTRP